MKGLYLITILLSVVEAILIDGTEFIKIEIGDFDDDIQVYENQPYLVDRYIVDGEIVDIAGFEEIHIDDKNVSYWDSLVAISDSIVEIISNNYKYYFNKDECGTIVEWVESSEGGVVIQIELENPIDCKIEDQLNSMIKSIDGTAKKYKRLGGNWCLYLNNNENWGGYISLGIKNQIPSYKTCNSKGSF